MVVGAGKLGQKLAESLVSENFDVTVVDTNSTTIDNINEHLDVLTVVGNGMDIRVLKELDIESFDLLVASTSSDETNTLICTLAKKLGCKETIARIRNPEYMEQLDFIKTELGIDHIVNPDLISAITMSKYLMKSYGVSTGDFASGRVLMIDFNIHSNKDFVGKKLMEIQGFEKLLITAISRNGNMLIPDGSTELKENDVIYIIGNNKEIEKISHRFIDDISKKTVNSVMILGGGNLGYYLADKLSKAKIQVTLVEIDKKRCHELSEKLNDVLVIYGDGTDIHLLEEESLSTMDAFVGATGFDEENLLMALVAKQAGVGKVISKISRQNYAKLIDTLGVDTAFNPVHIAVSNILKFIRGGKVISVSLLLGGEAEVIELIIGDDLPVVGKQISELGLPRGIIIGAIARYGEVIIPKGDTILKAKDKVVIFCLTEDLPKLNMFYKTTSNKGGIIDELWNRAKGFRNHIDN